MKEKQGNLSRVGLPKLLHLIYKKGDGAAVLDIVREPVKKRFYFSNGIPVFATSNILNEVLGRLLIQEGVITHRDYEQSLELVLKEKKRHGEVLTSMGLITNQQLEDFLSLQVKRRLLKIFSWNEGTYRYIKTESVPGNYSQHPLHPASLILEGISVGFYPEARLRADLKEYLDKPLKLAGHHLYSLDDFALNLQEKRFLENFDGQKTLSEVLASSDLLKQRALALSLSLIITGVLRDEAEKEDEYALEEESEIRPSEAAGDSRLNAEILFIKAKTALSEGDWEGAIKALNTITDLNPVEGEYWAYLGWAIYKSDPARLGEAEKLIKDSIDLNNELDSAWYFLGRIFLAEGDLVWAEKSFRTALQKNPWMVEAACELKRLEIRKESASPTVAHMEALKALGISKDPFREEPDEGLTVLSSGQRAAKEEAVKAVRRKSGFILIEGIEGSGKTTVGLEVLRSLSTDKVISSFILKPQDKEILIVKAINEELGASTDGATTKDQLLSLGMRVSQNKIQGGHTLIIIDNAHRLTSGCLKLIQYLSRIKTIQIMMLAEPSIEERLKTSDFVELDSKIVTRINIGALGEEEAASLIKARLRAASIPVEFDEAELKAIYQDSGGTPRHLIELASVRLSERAAPKKEEVAQVPEVETTHEPQTVETDFSSFDFDTAADERRSSTIDITPTEPVPPPVEQKPEVHAEPQKEVAAHKAPEKTPQHTAPSPHAPEHAAVHRHEETPVKKRGAGKIILWIIVVLIAGLIAGSLVGYFFFGLDSITTTPPSFTRPEPAKDVLTAPPADKPLDSPTVQGTTGGV